MWVYFFMPDLVKQVRCSACGHFLLEAETDLKATVRCASCRAACKVIVEGDRISCEVVRKSDKPTKAT